MRALVIAGLLMLTAGCGAYQFPGPGSSPSPSPAAGTVTGRVLAVPCAPVEQAGPNSCAGRPVPKLEIDYVGGDSGITKTVTDANGSYFVALAPGTYSVKLKTYMRVISGPLSITVAPGSAIVANYLLDSGIRLPVPQQ